VFIGGEVISKVGEVAAVADIVYGGRREE